MTPSYQEKEKKRREKKRAEQQALQERMQASAPPTKKSPRLRPGFVEMRRITYEPNGYGMHD